MYFNTDNFYNFSGNLIQNLPDVESIQILHNKDFYEEFIRCRPNPTYNNLLIWLAAIGRVKSALN